MVIVQAPPTPPRVMPVTRKVAPRTATTVPSTTRRKRSCSTRVTSARARSVNPIQVAALTAIAADARPSSVAISGARTRAAAPRGASWAMMRTAPVSTAARTSGTRSSAGDMACCSAIISASSRVQSIATEASRVPCRRRSASKASTSRPCRTSQTGLSGRSRAQARYASAARATIAQATRSRGGLHQAARTTTPAAAGPRAMTCGMSRLWPRRESSWHTNGATTSTPPTARPTRPAPIRPTTPPSPAATPAPSTARAPMSRPILRRPRYRARGRPVTVPSTIAAATTPSRGRAAPRAPATSIASAPSKAPRNRPAAHAYRRRRSGAGGALRGGCGFMDQSPCTS